jgi:hypothetical protein
MPYVRSQAVLFICMLRLKSDLSKIFAAVVVFWGAACSEVVSHTNLVSRWLDSRAGRMKPSYHLVQVLKHIKLSEREHLAHLQTSTISDLDLLIDSGKGLKCSITRRLKHSQLHKV